MKVRTKKGREVHLFDDVLCALLDADIVEKIVEPPKELPPHVTRWFVQTDASGKPAVRVSCGRGGEDIVLGRVEKYEFVHCGLREKIPPEIVEQYNNPDPVVHADGATFGHVPGEAVGLLKTQI